MNNRLFFPFRESRRILHSNQLLALKADICHSWKEEEEESCPEAPVYFAQTPLFGLKIYSGLLNKCCYWHFEPGAPTKEEKNKHQATAPRFWLRLADRSAEEFRWPSCFQSDLPLSHSAPPLPPPSPTSMPLLGFFTRLCLCAYRHCAGRCDPVDWGQVWNASCGFVFVAHPPLLHSNLQRRPRLLFDLCFGSTLIQMHAHAGMRTHAHNTHWCNGRKHIYKQPYSILMRQKNVSMAEHYWLSKYWLNTFSWSLSGIINRKKRRMPASVKKKAFWNCHTEQQQPPRMVFHQQDAGH